MTKPMAPQIAVLAIPKTAINRMTPQQVGAFRRELMFTLPEVIQQVAQKVTQDRPESGQGSEHLKHER